MHPPSRPTIQPAAIQERRAKSQESSEWSASDLAPHLLLSALNVCPFNPHRGAARCRRFGKRTSHLRWSCGSGLYLSGRETFSRARLHPRTVGRWSRNACPAMRQSSAQGTERNPPSGGERCLKSQGHAQRVHPRPDRSARCPARTDSQPEQHGFEVFKMLRGGSTRTKSPTRSAESSESMPVIRRHSRFYPDLQKPKVLEASGLD